MKIQENSENQGPPMGDPKGPSTTILRSLKKSKCENCLPSHGARPPCLPCRGYRPPSLLSRGTWPLPISEICHNLSQFYKRDEDTNLFVLNVLFLANAWFEVQTMLAMTVWRFLRRQSQEVGRPSEYIVLQQR